MSRSSAPVIVGSARRPLLTFALFAYNQAPFIREAVSGALAQDYENLEIIISDDCSTDGTARIIEETVEGYAGRHVVRLNRNPKNLGLVGHLNRVLELAKGELIVGAAGDDISAPTRASRCAAVHAGTGALLIHSRATRVDLHGRVLGSLVPPMVSRQLRLPEVATALSLYVGATVAWSPRLGQLFGPIVHPNAYEDLVMGFRAALLESIAYIDEPLVQYRVGSGMTTHPWYSDSLQSIPPRRQRALRVALDVFRQRLADLETDAGRPYQYLRPLLARALCAKERQLAFYEEPGRVAAELMAGERLATLGAVAREVAGVTRQAVQHVAFQAFSFLKERKGGQG